jgi:ubiquinone/menaquinone biosynthesis C-methylase UbiE
MQLVFELAGAIEGKRVLDVGTGDGSYAIEAAVRGAEVVGIDPDSAMLRAAAERASSRRIAVLFQQGRAEALSFPDAAFDLLLAVTALCFVHDAATAVREMVRVLRPSGLLVIGELGRWSLWAAGRRVRGWRGERTWRRARFWSRRELVRLVGGSGLRVEAVRGAIFYPPCDLAARALAPVDGLLGRLHAPGPAFLAVAGRKRIGP